MAMRGMDETTSEDVVVKKVERPVMRKELREDAPAATAKDDPRERAAKRAAELRQHNITFDDGVDKFYAPNAPDGGIYDWKRRTVMGWEDPSYMSNLERSGWEPVPSSRHPEMMPKGFSGSIERDGQILMERPKEITDEIRNIELRKARQQVQIKAGQLDPKGRGGLMDRDDANASLKVKQSYEAMPVPD